MPNFRLAICDDKILRDAHFSPRINPSGVTVYILAAENFGDGVSRPQAAGFPWDVSKLLPGEFHLDHISKIALPEKTKIKENSESDLVGNLRLGKGSVRFDCPRRLGTTSLFVRSSFLGRKSLSGIAI